MKIVSLILSIYFLTLACLPCSDARSMGTISDNQTTILTASKGHNLSHQKDGCTPLCVCSCCQIAATTPVQSFQITGLTKVADKPDAFLSFHIKEIPLSFWQPPKIQC